MSLINFNKIASMEQVDEQFEGPSTVKDEEFIRYGPLHRSILTGHWEGVKRFIDFDGEAVRGSITQNSDTALMVAVMSGQRIEFIQKLVDLLPSIEEDLGWKNREGNTALHVAAIVGHVKAAELLVEKKASLLHIANSDGNTALHEAAIVGHVEAAKLLVEKGARLLDIANSDGHLPLHSAAANGQREITLFFLNKLKSEWESDLESASKLETLAMVMHLAIKAKLFDVAFKLVRECPCLASKTVQSGGVDDQGSANKMVQSRGMDNQGSTSKGVQSGGVDVSPLEIIAEMPTAFESGTNLNIWQRFIYSIWRKLHNPWKLLETIVPHVKNVREAKFTLGCALRLVCMLCVRLSIKDDPSSSSILQKSFLLGAKHGIQEIVEAILMVFPAVISSEDEEERSALHLAVMYRRENIFNFIIQQKGGVYKQLLSKVDSKGNNILHLAGRLPYQPQLEVVSGAVLQMQRELQWYKEVEKFVSAQAIAATNSERKTPMMVFDEEHRRMIQSEQQWIVGMASACTVATTIIGTIAFAAVVQAPGGNNGEGRPILYKEMAFKVFAASNALALYSAISTFLIFLSIYNARYAAIDFLHALPNRLIFGLIALFFSVTYTMVAFGSALYLMCSQESQSVILIPVLILSCIPVALFVFFLFPLLLNMMKTTYGRSMFSQKKSKKLI